MPLSTEVGLGPGDIVLDGRPSSPPPQGAQLLPNFEPVSVVAKQSPILATAELLSMVSVSACYFEFSSVL